MRGRERERESSTRQPARANARTRKRDETKRIETIYQLDSLPNLRLNKEGVVWGGMKWVRCVLERLHICGQWQQMNPCKLRAHSYRQQRKLVHVKLRPEQSQSHTPVKAMTSTMAERCTPECTSRHDTSVPPNLFT